MATTGTTMLLIALDLASRAINHSNRADCLYRLLEELRSKVAADAKVQRAICRGAHYE